MTRETSSEFRSAIAEVSQSWEEITAALAVLSDCSERFMKLPSGEHVVQDKELEDLRKQLKEHERKQTEMFDGWKTGIQEDIAKEVSALVKDQLPEVLRQEAAKQVKVQVEEQIKDHMPVSLREQAEESRRQVLEIKASLENSEARINNSFIQISNLYDPLVLVLTPNGSRSPLYPSNVKSLLEYDLESAKALSKDYGLADTEDLQVNLQQFLRHIGTGIEVVIPCGIEG